jgi:hypothetical protein
VEPLEAGSQEFVSWNHKVPFSFSSIFLTLIIFKVVRSKIFVISFHIYSVLEV